MAPVTDQPLFDPWFSAWAYADALAVTRAPAEVWRRRQAVRLAELLQVAARTLRWSRLAPARCDAAQAHRALAALPPLGKAELMAKFEDGLTDPALRLPALREFLADSGPAARVYAGRCMVWESSGSTREPALFAHDARSLAVSDALEAARGPVSFSLRPGLKIAFVGAIDGAFASIVSLQRLRRINPWLATSIRPFSFLQPLPALLAQLQAWSPTVLTSYPSMAWVLAEAQRAGRLKLALQAVWTGGETLSPAQRQAITAAFDCPVFDNYGASECLHIASECRHQRLHVNADWVLLEPVDAQGRPVPPGVTGEDCLLTNFANHLQPLLRYRLGDHVCLQSEPCPCGSSLPVIQVQGRCDDTLSFEGDAGAAVPLAPLALTTVLEDEAGVFDFELRQLGPQKLRLQLFGADADARHRSRARAALRRYLEAQGLASVRVVTSAPRAGYPLGRSGKRQRVMAS